MIQASIHGRVREAGGRAEDAVWRVRGSPPLPDSLGASAASGRADRGTACSGATGERSTSDLIVRGCNNYNAFFVQAATRKMLEAMQQEEGSLKFLESTSIEGSGFLAPEERERQANSPIHGDGNIIGIEICLTTVEKYMLYIQIEALIYKTLF